VLYRYEYLFLVFSQGMLEMPGRGKEVYSGFAFFGGWPWAGELERVGLGFA
jgi:hypothetical protein